MSLSDGPGGLLSDLIEATIVGADTIPGEGYTLYAIQVTNKIDESSWTVYRRYSNFLSLQSQLPSGMIPSECTLHRGVLASSTAAEVVERRRQVLEDFMGVILSQPADLILQIRNVCDFLRLSVAITGGETPPCSSNNSSLISSESSETVPESVSPASKYVGFPAASFNVTFTSEPEAPPLTEVEPNALIATVEADVEPTLIVKVWKDSEPERAAIPVVDDSFQTATV